MFFTQFHMLLSSGFGRSLILMKIRGTSLIVKFVLTLFIAKFIGFEALGIYGIISALTLIIPAAIGLCLMQSISRKAVTSDIAETVSSIRHYLKYLIIIYSLGLPIIYFYGFTTDNLKTCLLVFFIVFLEHLNNDEYGLLLNLSRPLEANILHFTRVASWAIIYMPLAYHLPELQNLDSLLFGWLLGNVLSLIFFTFITRKWPWKDKYVKQPLINWIKKEFRQSRLLYASSVANTGNSYLNLFLITFLLSLELTGVYVFFSQTLSAMMNLIHTGVISINKPKLVKAYKDSAEAYYGLCIRSTIQTLYSSVLLALAAIPMMYIAVHYIVDKPLAEEWQPIFWIMLIGFILANVRESFFSIFYSQHADYETLKFNLRILFMMTCITPLMIYYFNLWGAVFSSLLALAANLIGITLKVKKYLKTYEPS